MAYGVPDGLVLKVVMNGNYEIVATQIKGLKRNEMGPILPDNIGERMDLPF